MLRRSVSALLLLPALLQAGEKLTPTERIELVRGLAAEYATTKILLPRSKGPLEISTRGPADKSKWDEALNKMGPAARQGDLIQFTKVDIDNDRILLEINGGAKGKRKWYERIEVGTGTRTAPISQGQTQAASGTTLLLKYPDGNLPRDPAQIKRDLAGIFDFERRNATEQFVDKLPPEQKKAVEEQRATEGMDRETVLLALGKPVRKIRETKDGDELEDWVYGTPPGKVLFITFQDGKVAKIKESFGALGGSTAPRVTVP